MNIGSCGPVLAIHSHTLVINGLNRGQLYITDCHNNVGPTPERCCINAGPASPMLS